jgi:uridine kinase
MLVIDEIDQLVAAIWSKQKIVGHSRSVLIGITGIDGCGKGYLTGRVVAKLRQQDIKAVAINVDDWLNFPDRRFNNDNPAEHFYEHAIRFEEMFQKLILPLKQNRQHSIVVDITEETSTEYRKHTYEFKEVGIIVLEGIYLLKSAYRHHYDLTCWVECTFETALERALLRRQEGLSPAETIAVYESVYFPAQRIHFIRDNPKAAADVILKNDPRLAGEGIRHPFL